MRICSLLPSATETVYALGAGDELVGVTHECDFPPEAARKPRVVQTVVDQQRMDSETIDRLVRETLRRGESLYRVDEATLAALRPDVVLLQDLCDVCAIHPASVRGIVQALPGPPRVLALHPHTLADVWSDIRAVGEAIGRARAAEALLRALHGRLQRVRERVAGAARPRVFCLEWLAPPMGVGHWVPEMVEWAGGHEVVGRAGSPSRAVAWEEIAAARPEVMVVMPCGFPIARTLNELPQIARAPGWQALPAVQHGRVYVVNGPAYYQAAGPRVVDGMELLAGVLHPERCAELAPHGADAVCVGASTS